MISYNWNVLQLETQLGEPQTTIVHWECSGSLNDNHGRSYGTCTLPVGEGLPTLADLATPEEVLALCWHEDKDGKPLALGKEETEANVKAQIDQQINTSAGVPWDTSLTHADYRKRALAKIDALHSSFMRNLTGNETDEEIASWPVKSAAARFVNNATDEEIEAEVALLAAKHPSANEDLAVIVSNVGGAVEDIRTQAERIAPKSLAYKSLIGLADNLRTEAKAAVTAATDDTIPLEEVPTTLDTIEAALTEKVQQKIAEFLGA